MVGFGVKALKNKLPRLIKRQLLLISAFAMLSKIDEPSKEVIDKLSRIFQSTSGDSKDVVKKSTAKVAFLLKDYTWKKLDESGIVVEDTRIPLDKEPTKIASEVDRNLLAIYLADNSPSWLKYGSYNLLVDDFKQILGHISASRLRMVNMGYA